MILRRAKKEALRNADPRERSLWADLLAVGMIFPIAILAGIFGGRWIGSHFGHAELGQWLGLVWGVAAAFWELFKTSKKLDRFNAAEAQDAAAKGPAPLEQEKDPGKDEDDDRP